MVNEPMGLLLEDLVVADPVVLMVILELIVILLVLELLAAQAVATVVAVHHMADQKVQTVVQVLVVL